MDKTCRRGHSLAEHGYLAKNGYTKCRLCDRMGANRRYERYAEKAKARANQRYKDNPARGRAEAKKQRGKYPEYYKEQTRRWIDKNPERFRETKRRWFADHPEEARAIRRKAKVRRSARLGAQLGLWHHLEAQIEALLFRSQAGLCYYCKDPLDWNSRKTFHLEHMIPLSRGGSHGFDNWCISCAPCNFKKHAKTAEEFMKLLAAKNKIYVLSD